MLLGGVWEKSPHPHSGDWYENSNIELPLIIQKGIIISSLYIVYCICMKKIIRITGIVVTALLIPVSILVLFVFQWVGNTHQVIPLLYGAWTLINFIAMPFMLLGFIIKYSIKTVIYLAVAHLTLSLANLALFFTDAVTGAAVLLAIITLPSLLYIAGVIAQKQSTIPAQSDT